MLHKGFMAVTLTTFMTLSLAPENEAEQQSDQTDQVSARLLSGNFLWSISQPLVAPAERPDDPCCSIKDPSIVFYQGRWHLFCTIRSQKRTHQIEYLSFTNWNDANSAERHILKMHSGYFCAPQVFYFTPHKKWYLICQASDKSWQPEYQPAYSTASDIADPDSWTPLIPLGAKQADGKTGLDFWIICDETMELLEKAPANQAFGKGLSEIFDQAFFQKACFDKTFSKSFKAHLFFTTLDGRMWREETSLENYPTGWSEPSLAIQGDIFEASHTYKLKGLNKYMTLVEAQGGYGWRYYKAYLANRLDGEWTPLADTKDKTFASMANTQPTEPRWTDSVSHGELLRAGYDQALEVDPVNLRFLFQGVSDKDKEGKSYGEIPWRLGLLSE